MPSGKVPFGDISNVDTGQEEGASVVVKTFSRRNRLASKAPAKDGTPMDPKEAQPAAATQEAHSLQRADSTEYDFSAAPESLTAVAAGSRAEQIKGKRGKKDAAAGGSRAYTRKVAPSAKEQGDAAREAYFAEMRAYFAEVDDFQLQEASPVPGGRDASVSPATQHSLHAQEILPLPTEHAPATLQPGSATLQPGPSPNPQSVVRRTAAWVPYTSPLPISFPAREPPYQADCKQQADEATGDLLGRVQQGGEGDPVEKAGLPAMGKTGGDGEAAICEEEEDGEEVAAEELEDADLAGSLCAGLSRGVEAQAPCTLITEGSERGSESLMGAAAAMPDAAAEEALPAVQGSAFKPQGSIRKAPSLGMSRRSSVCFAAQDVGGSEAAAGQKSSLAAPPLPRASLVRQPEEGQAVGRRSSVAQQLEQEARPRRSLLSRLSGCFSLDQGFARLSNGLAESLHRLGLSGALPASQQEPQEGGQDAPSQGCSRVSFEGLHSPAARNVPVPRRGSTWGVKEFSPIAESPEVGSDAAPTPAAEAPTQSSSQIPEDADFAVVADITQAFAEQLDLGEPENVTHMAVRLEEAKEDSLAEPLTPLQELLRVCNQEVDVAVIPSMEALLGQHVDLAQVRKIGEGTFGEAFKGGNVVFKIVPMDGSLLIIGEVQKRSDEILAEVAISIILSQLRGVPGEETSNTTAGFVETHGVGVCRGQYAPALLREWHAWDERNGSENDPVDAFPSDQLYVVFVVADGGVDLERFQPHSFGEARAILLQCALTLAVAEEACDFEHRDLHWGNLLIKRDLLHTSRFRLRGIDIEVRTEGLAITLIDFTLSRLRTITGDVAFCDLSADPELFQGPKGDCQADTYRRMKKATKGDWQKHTACTNALWMHYLADTLLTKKQIPLNAQQKRELRAFRKRAIAAGSCSALLWDEFFEGMWLAGQVPAEAN